MKSKKGQGRPIGKRVIQAMEVLERMGDATYTDVWAFLEEVPEVENAGKYLRRATSYGLAQRIPGKPLRYRAVPNWRQYLIAPPPDPKPDPLGPRPVSSVWELGTRYLEFKSEPGRSLAME